MTIKLNKMAKIKKRENKSQLKLGSLKHVWKT